MSTKRDGASQYIDFWDININVGDFDCTKYKLQTICTEIEDVEFEMIE